MKINSVYPYCEKFNRFKSNRKITRTNTIPLIQSNNYLNRCSHPVSFTGYPVYIIDGGAHAENMEHFANAVSKDMDTTIINVDVVPTDPNVKKLKSLEEQLKTLNERDSFNRNEFITIPALASVSILNVQDQYNHVMRENKKFTPENVKANKENLLLFLKKIYDNPRLYRTYIGYMDKINQGIEYTYGVIREINKLVEKGANVYVPSGHPQDETLKWMAGDRGYKPELYHFISSGYDKDGVIKKMHDEIKSNNWYDFNLLSLSNANVVGVKDSKGAQDYMFAAYDSCVTDSARGVYNFSPVRKNDKLVGYSYTDTITNEYPYEEFPDNDKIENITKFVGKKLSEVIATRKETLDLKKCIKEKNDINSCADKLYKIEDIFNKTTIKNKKLDLEGKYTDRTRTLFFDTNNLNEVVFPKCNCEGSQKPSVLSMWGSCFSTINAIARDIKIKETAKENHTVFNINREKVYLNQMEFKQIYKNKIEELLKKGINTRKLAKGEHLKYYKEASDYFQDAIEKNKILANEFNDMEEDYRLHYNLGLLHEDFGKMDYAEACFNNSLNILCKKLIFFDFKGKTISEIKEGQNKYNNLKIMDELYDKQLAEYSQKSFLSKLFAEEPQKPQTYGTYTDYENDCKIATQIIPILSEMYSKLGKICENNGNTYASSVCNSAAEDLIKMNDRANEIIKRRADKVHYIGDLYPEIRKEKV